MHMLKVASSSLKNDYSDKVLYFRDLDHFVVFNSLNECDFRFSKTVMLYIDKQSYLVYFDYFMEECPYFIRN